MLLYIGIDNGISGGLCALSSRANVPPIAMIPMPFVKARKGNEVDVRAVHKLLSDVTNGNLSNAFYFVEEPGGSKSAKAACSMAASFHCLRGFFETKMLRWERVTPQKWQKALLPSAKAGDTKARAWELARRLWPDESFLASPRCRTPHDGMIDAALIAEWARRTFADKN